MRILIEDDYGNQYSIERVHHDSVLLKKRNPEKLYDAYQMILPYEILKRLMDIHEKGLLDVHE